MAKLLFGSDLRLMECVRLRVKDLDFAQRQIIVRDGKGMEEKSRQRGNPLGRAEQARQLSHLSA
jgi:site-specific recombinase XerD